MAEIMKYSDSFNQRYEIIPLPANFYFLFKPGRIGANYLEELNKASKQKNSIRYLKEENTIEIYVQPNQNIIEFDKKI